VAKAKKPQDKRVYDIRITIPDNDRWLILAISGDATLAELHLALLGAFEWSGSYTGAERVYRFVMDGGIFENGKGSRTALRRLLRTNAAFEYRSDFASIEAHCSVLKQYEVPNRRHYPKVIDAHPGIRAQGATWKAQMAARREYREYEGDERRLASLERSQPPPDPSSAYAHGFFSALVAGPMVAPAMWLERFLPPAAGSIDELNTSAQRVMAIYNEVADQLLRQREWFGEATLGITKGDTSGQSLVDWQLGFLDGMGQSPDEWTAFLKRLDRDVLQPLAAIHQLSEDASKRSWLTDQELRENLGCSIGIMTVRLWEAYRDQPSMLVESASSKQALQVPAIPRNAPCPCGSGKKYKLCCGSTLRTV
jgi:uncharacterized protein